MSMEKIKAKKAGNAKLKRPKKVNAIQASASLNRGEVAKGGNGSSKTKPIT